MIKCTRHVSSTYNYVITFGFRPAV